MMQSTCIFGFTFIFQTIHIRPNGVKTLFSTALIWVSTVCLVSFRCRTCYFQQPAGPASASHHVDSFTK